MKKNSVRVCIICILAFLIVSIGLDKERIIGSSTANDVIDMYYLIQVDSKSKKDEKIKVKEVDGESYLFLPSSADLSSVNLYYTVTDDVEKVTVSSENENEILFNSGDALDVTNITSFDSENSNYPLTIGIYLENDTKYLKLNIMKSENISSAFLISADSENEGRDYIESSKEHTLATTGNLSIINEQGNIDYYGSLAQIKGRGNTSWITDKKSYQVKLDKKADLMNTGNDNNKNKTWLFIGAISDGTQIHNILTYKMAQELGMLGSVDSKSVDFYYDGEYRGTYLLTEKVEIKSGRVDIVDQEENFVSDDPNNSDLDTLETKQSTNRYNNKYQYVDNLINNSADYSGGYLLELDNYYYNKEKSYFFTNSGMKIVSKNPEYLSESAMKYISELWQEFETSIVNLGMNEETGKAYSDYIDVESLAKYIMLQEWASNPDVWRSSTYFYKNNDQVDDKLYAGPTWDMESSFVTDIYDWRFEQYTSAYWPGIGIKENWVGDLMKIPSFQDEFKRIFQNELYPIVMNSVLDENSGSYVKSVRAYQNELTDSLNMNFKLWVPTYGRYETLPQRFDSLIYYISEHTQWMMEQINSWNGTDITHEEITIESPVIGEIPDTEASIAEYGASCVISDVSWMNSPSQFLGATEYTANVTLDPIESAKFNATNLKITVNGDEANNIIYNDNGSITVQYTFPSTPIESAQISVAVPVANEKSTEAYVGDSCYKVVETKWNPENENFQYNTAYTISVKIEPIEGYKFDSDVEATINNNQMVITQKDESYIIASYTFPKTEIKKDNNSGQGIPSGGSSSDETPIDNTAADTSKLTDEAEKVLNASALNASNITLAIKDSKQITVYNLESSDKINKAIANGTLSKKIEYKVADSSVATIDNSGKILGKKAGTTTIDIIITIGDISKTLQVNVNVEKMKQTVSASSCKLNYSSKKYALEVKLEKGNGKLTYSSSNTKVASVDKNGTIKMNGYGVTTITIVSSSTSTYQKATKKITVTVKPIKASIKSVTITKSKNILVTWKKDLKANGYVIEYSTDSNFKKDVKKVYISNNKTTSKTLNIEDKGKKYYVRICSYTKDNTQKINGAYSGSKSIKVK
ncbi:CotH kinase family protein [Anaerosporobacter sp.]|uniref:CotH kinase family protein n=1 Tax=Anaerosporobacter sp. TaxID=1872529 RepID=UPI00286EEB94|nr:CotH kinase family protein [Anaerosporobacter sp.]